MKKSIAGKSRFARIKSLIKNNFRRMNFKSNPRLSAFVCGLIFLVLIFVYLETSPNAPLIKRNFPFFAQTVSAENLNETIENAVYARQEFFGAEAIVALPTAETRENLARLAESYPDNREILKKLAATNEKLERFDDAETNLLHLAEIDFSENTAVADFYERRGAFEKEAEIMRKILFSTSPEKRSAAFENLIYLAGTHDLKQYQQTDFYALVAKENPHLYPIFANLIERLTETEDYAQALDFARQAKLQFPEKADVLLDKEIEILLAMNKPKEAEAVYQTAFDPFWSSEEAEKFYDFLNGQDRLRAYGAEMKNRFKRNSADFDAAIRLALYQNHDYEYGNDDITPIILKLEQAKKSWTIEELVIATRLLLNQNAGETASRFLYTLYLREDFQKNSELRAKVLYQLFEMFADAERTRLPLTKGDLRFYEDVAQADTNPGIATGILSLIFSDTNPRGKLGEQESKATQYFNRAAAYRIFLAYKEEFPTSPELAQMYLDITRLYTATEETEIAEQTLNEFAARFENASDFPAVALKLADAFAAVKQPEKERETYQKILDYLGKQGKPLVPRNEEDSETSNEFQTFPGTRTIEISAGEKTVRDDGINIPKINEKPKNEYYYDEPASRFHDYLGRKNIEITYSEILERYVAALAKEKKTTEILALYSNEVDKYPNEEWLYEQRLTWLEQTNLTDEQLKVYKAALARFQSRGWQDKLARFFLRQKRTDEFAAFSEDLIGKLNEAETIEYLSQTAEPNLAGKEFEKRILLTLLKSAHERFPHNIELVKSLLRLYQTKDYQTNWRELSAAYYFESSEIREQFLNDLAAKGELRNYLQKSQDKTGLIYELFRADACARLSDFENAVAAYRKLNEIYPNTPEFSSRLINFTRSFGQKNSDSLRESANLAKARADFLANRTDLRTTSGEIFAELGDYKNAREEWEKLIGTAKGEQNNYLATATVYWDYFQFDDALRTIKNLREKFADDTLYAFETGVILEAHGKQTEALAEYVKALDANRDDAQKEKSEKHLANLFKRAAEKTGTATATENQFLQMLDAAFETERRRRKDASYLALGYAETLFKIKQIGKAEVILNRAVGQSLSGEFLEAARNLYEAEAIKAGEQIVLRRLAETSENSRSKIMFELQLAENFEESRDRAKAKIVLANLVKNFPTNYGVLTEAANFYGRLGFEEEAARMLQNALPKSRGQYRNALAQNLAGRLIKLEKFDSAEQILFDLHEQNEADTSVFEELARIYVRRGEPEKMRQVFRETVAALKSSDADRRELAAQISDLRGRMIDAFTRLGDYQSALEQHIEIINRDAENEQLTENAIRYVKRYGGAETLLNYYQKISAEAFKNYRWNVVLAKIYEANGDAENAIKNYKTAIVNQPEMPELYDAIADIEAKRNNFDEALKNLDTVLEFTRDAPEPVKKKIEILKRAGRLAEIEAEQAKLPADTKINSTVDRFAAARNLENGEREKAREIYRQAFAALLENPLQMDLKAADIASYARIARDEESLADINRNLWTLREKLAAIAVETNSTDAGEARKRLSTLDAAITESVGNIAKTMATDEELINLHEDLRRRIETNSVETDEQNKIVFVVQDLSRRAGFGDLEEMILLKRLNPVILPDEKQIRLQNLINFYNERGAYQKTFDVLEKYGSDNFALKAESARLVGNREKELEALRAIYGKPNEITVATDENAARYLEILRAEKPDELKSLTEKSSAYQLQLINFLLGAGEAKLAHRAIESASLLVAWKVSRNAEVSLALKEFDDAAECYFCDALQFDSIGNMIRQTPDKKNFLVSDDWFHLTREYGEWLGQKENRQVRTGQNFNFEADKYLAAMIENLPQSGAEQFKLGEFYLKKNQPEKAIEHLRLAIEIENAEAADKTKMATLGAAYAKAGRRGEAEEIWARVLEDKEIEGAAIYFQTLQKFDLSGDGRERLPNIIVKFLTHSNADNSPEFQNLIRAVAASFSDETEKAKYFLEILQARPTDVSLAEMLLNENLIAKNEQNSFYELLINRAEKSDNYDYKYDSIYQRVWKNTIDAESIYDQENEYEIEEPTDERFGYQKHYLELLVKQRENGTAESLVSQIEKELKNRYARPDWLRLSKIRLQARREAFDLSDAERFVGIMVSDSATEIHPPSIERFNRVLQILKEEKADAESVRLSEDFFARMLALGQFDAANFVGLARAFFQKGETETALRVLRLMIDASDAERRELALAEIAALETIKTKTTDAAKTLTTETNDSFNRSENLKLAAETALEFQQPDAAIEFRRRLLEINQSDAPNKIELAKLLLQKGEKSDAVNFLNDVIDNRNALRSTRWQARLILFETDENTTFPDNKFDAFAQFYKGLFAEKAGQTNSAGEFFVNSLIADKDAEIAARQRLVKSYISADKFFAALKLAATDKTAKDNELLAMLSEAAAQIGDFNKAIEFEKAKSSGGNSRRIEDLQIIFAEKSRLATSLKIDLENTRNL